MNRTHALVLAGGVLAAGLTTAGVAAASADVTCASFTFQEDAQAAVATDPALAVKLDVNANGVVCESLPHRKRTQTTTTETTTTTSETETTTSPPTSTTTTSRSSEPTTPSTNHQVSEIPLGSADTGDGSTAGGS